MGSYFSNLQIRKTKELNPDKIKEAVSALMERIRYKTVSNQEEADVNVIIYNGDSPWVSVFSDGIEVYDNKTSEALLKPLSAELDTDVMAVSCFDSDYLFLNLINESEKINAWANVGSPPEGRFPRKTVFSSWKSRVSDFDRFKSAIREKYDFAENVLEPLESILNLPVAQSCIDVSNLDEFESKKPFTCLYFSLSGDESPKEPTELKITHFSLTPCRIGENNIITAINTGGSSRGIAIAFIGDYVENEDIFFTDVKLEYDFDKTPRKEIPVQLSKQEIAKGTWAYCAEIPDFLIPDKVNPDLPPKRKKDLEFAREIGIRFTPLGNPKKLFDICVHFIPLDNPQGQCCWCVWLLDGSKEAYIENSRKRLSIFRRKNGL